MNAWKVILSTLVIFIAGVVTGGLLVTYSEVILQRQNHPKQPAANANPAANVPWIARNRELLRRMDRELELTPEQHKQIETIINDFQERTKALWKPIAPQMSKEVQRVHNDIRDVLTADQKKKFEGLVRQPRPGGGHRTNSVPEGATNSIPSAVLSTNAATTN